MNLSPESVKKTLLNKVNELSASKAELLKHFDFNASAPTASALIQQRKKISPEAFDSLFTHFPMHFSSIRL